MILTLHIITQKPYLLAVSLPRSAPGSPTIAQTAQTVVDLFPPHDACAMLVLTPDTALYRCRRRRSHHEAIGHVEMPL
jgi:hypothetical protein